MRARLTKVAALIFAGIVVISGCSTSPGAPVEYDPPKLTERLMAIQHGGKSTPLRDLVAGDWTAVHIYSLVTFHRKDVESEIGYKLDMRDEFLDSDGALLVFINDEQVVRAAVIYDLWFKHVHKSGNKDSIIEQNSTTGNIEIK